MSRKVVSEGRRRRSGGNVVLESALTLIPTFALIFALLDFGFMLFRWSTLQNAIREGARYAITFQRETVGGVPQGQDTSISDIVQHYAMGMVKTSDSPKHIFVNYYSTTAPNTPIVSGGNIPGNIVEVSVQNISFGWLAPISGKGFGLRSIAHITFKVYSSDILGGFPVGVSSVPR